MKRHLKRYTSLKNYIEFLKKQPKHMQHVYAITFAGAVTVLIASVVLYVDYGFWHEKYSRDDELVVNQIENVEKQTTESPSEMLSSFFGEAKEQFSKINTTGRDVLNGKETYKKEE